jgi:hypothetical protein
MYVLIVPNLNSSVLESIESRNQINQDKVKLAENRANDHLRCAQCTLMVESGSDEVDLKSTGRVIEAFCAGQRDGNIVNQSVRRADQCDPQNQDQGDLHSKARTRAVTTVLWMHFEIAASHEDERRMQAKRERKRVKVGLNCDIGPTICVFLSAHYQAEKSFLFTTRRVCS